MTIPTPTSRRRINRRLDLKRQAAERQRQVVKHVIGAMRTGAFLHMQHHQNGRFWTLSNGQPVATDVAAIIISRADVVATGGSLFHDLLGQTWCHVELREQD